MHWLALFLWSLWLPQTHKFSQKKCVQHSCLFFMSNANLPSLLPHCIGKFCSVSWRHGNVDNVTSGISRSTLVSNYVSKSWYCLSVVLLRVKKSMIELLQVRKYVLVFLNRHRLRAQTFLAHCSWSSLDVVAGTIKIVINYFVHWKLCTELCINGIVKHFNCF